MDNADLSLVFLSSNGVVFIEPTEDDWYRTAETPVNVTYNTGNESSILQYYVPQEPASPLACTEQYQFCRGAMSSEDNNRTCGPFASLRDAIDGAAPLFDSRLSWAQRAKVDPQMANVSTPLEAHWLYFTTVIRNAPIAVNNIIARLGPTALQSQRTLTNDFQGPLDNMQWQLDVKQWWDISKAATQAAFINTVHGPADPGILLTRENFSSPLGQFCHSQVCMFSCGHGL